MQRRLAFRSVWKCWNGSPLRVIAVRPAPHYDPNGSGGSAERADLTPPTEPLYGTGAQHATGVGMLHACLVNRPGRRPHGGRGPRGAPERVPRRPRNDNAPTEASACAPKRQRPDRSRGVSKSLSEPQEHSSWRGYSLSHAWIGPIARVENNDDWRISRTFMLGVTATATGARRRPGPRSTGPPSTHATASATPPAPATMPSLSPA